MSQKPFVSAAWLGAALVLSTTAVVAQQDKMYRPPQKEAATIYRDAYFSGPAVYVDGARPDMGLAWPVNSIRIESGRWQLCEKKNYRGTCKTYDVTTPLMSIKGGQKVQSLRPIGGTGGGDWGGGSPVPGTNPNLRGMAAQFFAAPAVNKRRVLACPTGSATANCAAASADRFCVQNGWTGSANESMQTVSGREYLVDVLCTRTGY